MDARKPLSEFDKICELAGARDIEGLREVLDIPATYLNYLDDKTQDFFYDLKICQGQFTSPMMKLAYDGKHEAANCLLEAFIIPNISTNDKRHTICILLSHMVYGYLLGGYDKEAKRIIEAVNDNPMIDREGKQFIQGRVVVAYASKGLLEKALAAVEDKGDLFADVATGLASGGHIQLLHEFSKHLAKLFGNDRYVLLAWAAMGFAESRVLPIETIRENVRCYLSYNTKELLPIVLETYARSGRVNEAIELLKQYPDEDTSKLLGRILRGICQSRNSQALDVIAANSELCALMIPNAPLLTCAETRWYSKAYELFSIKWNCTEPPSFRGDILHGTLSFILYYYRQQVAMRSLKQYLKFGPGFMNISYKILSGLIYIGEINTCFDILSQLSLQCDIPTLITNIPLHAPITSKCEATDVTKVGAYVCNSSMRQYLINEFIPREQRDEVLKKSTTLNSLMTKLQITYTQASNVLEKYPRLNDSPLPRHFHETTFSLKTKLAINSKIMQWVLLGLATDINGKKLPYDIFILITSELTSATSRETIKLVELICQTIYEGAKALLVQNKKPAKDFVELDKHYTNNGKTRLTLFDASGQHKLDAVNASALLLSNTARNN